MKMTEENVSQLRARNYPFRKQKISNRTVSGTMNDQTFMCWSTHEKKREFATGKIFEEIIAETSQV